jgi:RNA polymerase sigma-70 factor, ECF subfamily
MTDNDPAAARDGRERVGTARLDLPRDADATVVTPGARTAADDAERMLLQRLRAGDVEAFSGLVQRWHRLLLHVCARYVSSPAVAEEVVQETWMAVIDGLNNFQGRSTFRSWICSIAVNRARVHARRERRVVLTLEGEHAGGHERAAGADAGLDLASESSGWPWDELTPEALLFSAETYRAFLRAVDELPPGMRAVLVLRDIEGVSALETCQILNLTEANQRVLLHRARTRLRGVLGTILQGD